jgi:hypothetical protein
MRNLTRALLASLVSLTILLLGAGSGAQAVVLSASQWTTPLELDFGPVALGATSPTLVATITNSGDVPHLAIGAFFLLPCLTASASINNAVTSFAAGGGIHAIIAQCSGASDVSEASFG